MGKFDKSTGAPISKADSDKKAKKWKDNKNKKVETNASFIGRDWIEKLLAKPGCTGIWVNYGESEDGKSLEPYFIAGDKDGNYIMSDETKSNASVAASDDIINFSTKCPPDCPPQ